MGDVRKENTLDIHDWREPTEIRERTYSDEEIEEIRDELEEYYDDAGGMGMIRHPLITYLGYDPDSRETVTMLGRWIAQKRRGIEQFTTEKNWSQVLMLHEKPWRMHALVEYAPQMDDAEYWQELGSVWCGIEDPRTYLGELPWLFNPEYRGTKKRHLMMTEEERVALQALPDKLTIYRGCAEENRVGFSWSMDREQGNWFARRCGLGAWNDSGPFLLIGECRKSDVIAHFTRRDEAEIVINPDDVRLTETFTIPATHAEAVSDGCSTGQRPG